MINFKILLTSSIVLFAACSNNNNKSDSQFINRTPSLPIETSLVIGLEGEADSISQILGEPVSVVTDKEENIYIGDKASLSIKVFDNEGNYIKSLGRRGRGPNEFHDINFMGFTSDSNLIVLDRGNFRYTTITTSGEYIDHYTIDFENQFYLQGIDSLDDKIVGLYLYQGKANEPEFSDLYTRHFFRILSQDLETKYEEFGPFNELGITDSFGWLVNAIYQGSFKINQNSRELFFSPGIYSGKIYAYKENKNEDWFLYKTFTGSQPRGEPYITYSTEKEYQENEDFPAVWTISFSGAVHRGRLFSVNMGLFVLPDKNEVVHFYGEWREGNVTLEQGNPLDVFVQLFDSNGNVLQQSYLFSLEYDQVPTYPFVSWMDKNNNFYLIDYSGSAPLVRRFSLGF